MIAFDGDHIANVFISKALRCRAIMLSTSLILLDGRAARIRRNDDLELFSVFCCRRVQCVFINLPSHDRGCYCVSAMARFLGGKRRVFRPRCIQFAPDEESEPPAKPEAWFCEPLKGAVTSDPFPGGTSKSNGPRMNTDQHGSGELLFSHRVRPCSSVGHCLPPGNVKL